VRHHHEHYDGSGYPDGLVGEEIPLGSRILAVIDSYNAMRDKRVYKEARSHEETVRELIDCSGLQFDAEVVKTFMKLVDNGIINVEPRSAAKPSGEPGDSEAA
jgi:HD-GYP domain-containing protein (c-di-GMP phosphodiesterase class II)